MTTAEILLRLQNVSQVNGGWQATCPAHPDSTPSLSISEGKGGKTLMSCHAGCKIEQIVAVMGLQMSDLFPPIAKPQLVETYDYQDAMGNLLYQVCRYFPKNFKQRRPDGQGGFKWSMKGVERVLYRLPDVVTAIAAKKIIFIVEGEKDVHALQKLGIHATCNSGGAGNWLPQYTESLAGASIIIIADKDKAGREHAQLVAGALHGKASGLRVLELPNRGTNKIKDAYDWVSAGGNLEELREIINKTQKWTPQLAEYKSATVGPTGDSPLNYTLEIVENEKGKEKHVITPLPFNKVIDKLTELSKDQLARVDNIIFSKPDVPGAEVQYLQSTASFFGSIGVSNKTTIDWTSIHKAMKKDEAFSAITLRLKKYRGIETAPHYPEMDGLFYNYPALPEPDYDSLIDLIQRFNPETPEDSALILSMFLTSLWGGGEGQRPAFVMTSKDGRGSGKSTVGEMLAAVLGQRFLSGSTKTPINELTTRILSPEGLTSRIVIFDNETGRVSSGELAALVTCPIVSGKRLYVGEGCRPNNLLWIITLNTPTLDSDLASRSIPISIKKPTYDGDWKENILTFIAEHRWGIVAAMLDLLKIDTPALTSSSRWGSWENQVLAKVSKYYPDVAKLQSLFIERQRSFDDEADEISLIHDGFVEAINASGVDPEQYPCFIKNALASDIYNEVTGARVRRNTALRDIKNMIRMGAIPELKEFRHFKYGRGFTWTSKTAFEQELQLVTRAEPSTFSE